MQLKSQIVEALMLEWFVKSEVEIFWKEVVMVWLWQCPGFSLEGLR
jgi:hypothetical protein